MYENIAVICSDPADIPVPDLKPILHIVDTTVRIDDVNYYPPRRSGGLLNWVPEKFGAFGHLGHVQVEGADLCRYGLGNVSLYTIEMYEVLDGSRPDRVRIAFYDRPGGVLRHQADYDVIHVPGGDVGDVTKVFEKHFGNRRFSAKV